MSEHALIAKHRDTGTLGTVIIDTTEHHMSEGERFWRDFRDPADDPAGYVVVPLWPFTPSGCRAVKHPDDPFKKHWTGGQYLRGPIARDSGLVAVGVPIRVRSRKYAELICQPPNEQIQIATERDGKPVTITAPQLAEWPERMYLEKIPPVYRDLFGNRERWKPKALLAPKSLQATSHRLLNPIRG